MNYIETVDDIVMESEIEILMKMGDMYQKQLIMESYYMEEETPKEEPKEEKNNNVGEAPKVDGVNALKRFWNWLRRCVYAIKTQIYKRLNAKRFKKTIETIKKFIEICNIAYSKHDYATSIHAIAHHSIPLTVGKTISAITDLMKVLSANNGVDVTLDEFFKIIRKNSAIDFDSHVNYQHMSEDLDIIQRSSADYSKNKQLLKDLAKKYNNEKSVYYKRTIDDRHAVDTTLGDLVEDLSNYEGNINYLTQINLEIEKLIKNSKQSFDDEIVKSNNFQQYVNYLTIVMKSNLMAIQLVDTILNCIDQIFDIKNMKKNIENYKA